MTTHTTDDLDAATGSIDTDEEGTPPSAVERARIDAQKRLEAIEHGNEDASDLLIASQALSRHREDVAEIREQYQRAGAMFDEARLVERILQGVIERRAGIDDAVEKVMEGDDGGEQ